MHDKDIEEHAVAGSVSRSSTEGAEIGAEYNRLVDASKEVKAFREKVLCQTEDSP